MQTSKHAAVAGNIVMVGFGSIGQVGAAARAQQGHRSSQLRFERSRAGAARFGMSFARRTCARCVPSARGRCASTGAAWVRARNVIGGREEGACDRRALSRSSCATSTAPRSGCVRQRSTACCPSAAFHSACARASDHDRDRGPSRRGGRGGAGRSARRDDAHAVQLQGGACAACACCCRRPS